MTESTSQRHGFLAVGNWIVDQVKVIDAWPQRDALATIRSMVHSNGGGPYNVSKALALLGAPFPLFGAGRVGDDDNGQAILDDLREHGIDTGRFLVTPGVSTSFTDVMTEEDTGRRTFFFHPGANAALREEDLSLEAEDSIRLLYLGYLLALEGLDEVDADGSTGAARLLERASAAGYTTLVDLVSATPDRFQDVVPPALPYTDVLLLNEYEAGCLLGRAVAAERSEMVKAAEEVVKLGVRQRVILHAAGGAVAVDSRGGVSGQGAVDFPMENIRGASGAGDAFAAGIIFGLHEGWEIEPALRTAASVAAMSLQDETPSGAIGPLDEALQLGDRFGFKEF